MKTADQIKDKIIQLSKENKPGAAGSKTRGTIDGLNWVLE